MEQNLLRLGEAAAVANVNERTIRRWAEGGMPSVQVGRETRYPRTAVESAMKRRRKQDTQHAQRSPTRNPRHERVMSHSRLADLKRYGVLCLRQGRYEFKARLIQELQVWVTDQNVPPFLDEADQKGMVLDKVTELTNEWRIEAQEEEKANHA